jgi:S-DNA-T family DNA segregation ATPase FtsK/SpoIIIE
LKDYVHPTIDLLEDYEASNVQIDREELQRNKEQIVTTLRNYKIEITKIRATIGPTVTLYEIVPAAGVKISKIKNLENDIALSLAALGIRIIAPIPGKGTIGIEVPNKNSQTVGLKSILQSDKFQNGKMDLPIALGKTIANEPFVADLAKMPHLLIAGATGQGKSVGINTIITSLLYKKHPSQVKLVLIDPKKVELYPYSSLEKHFLGFLPDADEPIITDTTKVIHTLNSLTIEMDERYDLLKKARARNIKEYNAKFTARKLNPNNGHRFLPFIVLVIDEFADLIMTAGKEVELPIARIAQLARAVGIHMIIATQRPTTNIITGMIKANFPARISFKVTSLVDSRTILDAKGAEQLIGRGDMLLTVGSDLIRLQCAFVDTPEVERIIDHIGEQRGYAVPFHLPEFKGEGEIGGEGSNLKWSDLDENFEDAAKLIVAAQSGSTSLIQRKMSLGYNRAGRIMDQLESCNVVGPSNGSKPREVYFMTEMELIGHFDRLKNA